MRESVKKRLDTMNSDLKEHGLLRFQASYDDGLYTIYDDSLDEVILETASGNDVEMYVSGMCMGRDTIG